MNLKPLKLLVLLLLTTVVGCVKEPYEDCPTLRLRFFFTLNTEETNLFNREVHALKVCFFGMDSVLKHVEAVEGDFDNDYQMPLYVPAGQYYIVVWGSQSTTPARSFKTVTMTDTLAPVYETGLKVGQTTLDQMRLMIQYQNDEHEPTQLVPAQHPIDDLFFGALGHRRQGSSIYDFDTITLMDDQVIERDIELIRNTNIIDITIEGLQFLSDEGNSAATTTATTAVDMWLHATNARNNFKNAIDESARDIRYSPVILQNDADVMHTQIHTMRLEKERHQRQPIILSFKNTINPQSTLLPDLDLIPILLQVRDSVTGAFVYQTQEDFDRIYVHPIKIVIGADLKVSIVIHNWKIVPVIPRPFPKKNTSAASIPYI